MVQMFFNFGFQEFAVFRTTLLTTQAINLKFDVVETQFLKKLHEHGHHFHIHNRAGRTHCLYPDLIELP